MDIRVNETDTSQMAAGSSHKQSILETATPVQTHSPTPAGLGRQQKAPTTAPAPQHEAQVNLTSKNSYRALSAIKESVNEENSDILDSVTLSPEACTRIQQSQVKQHSAALQREESFQHENILESASNNPEIRVFEMAPKIYIENQLSAANQQFSSDSRWSRRLLQQHKHTMNSEQDSSFEVKLLQSRKQESSPSMFAGDKSREETGQPLVGDFLEMENQEKQLHDLLLLRDVTMTDPLETDLDEALLDQNHPSYANG